MCYDHAAPRQALLVTVYLNTAWNQLALAVLYTTCQETACSRKHAGQGETTRSQQHLNWEDYKPGNAAAGGGGGLGHAHAGREGNPWVKMGERVDLLMI